MHRWVKTIMGIVAIVLIILLFSSTNAFGVPAAPSPTCKITAEILKIDFVEGSPDTDGHYRLKVRINEVSTVFSEWDSGDKSCDECYAIGSEPELIVFEQKTVEEELFKEGEYIEGEIHFEGDEHWAGIILRNWALLTDYTIVNQNKTDKFTYDNVTTITLNNDSKQNDTATSNKDFENLSQKESTKEIYEELLETVKNFIYLSWSLIKSLIH